MRLLSRKQRFVRCATLAAGLVPVCLSAEGCVDTSEPGFQCGVAFNDDDTMPRSCSRPDEVCICATHSCAVPVDSSSTDEGGARATGKCVSKFRYVDAPFASEALRCVELEHVPSRLPVDGNGLCESRATTGSSSARVWTRC